MDTLIYVLFISLFFPLLMLMLLVEKRARLPIVFVIVGMFIAVFTSELNGVLMNVMEFSEYDATVNLAPITEELLKAIPILFFALVISDRRERLFTASMATGIGFAVLENTYHLIVHIDSFSLLSAMVRGLGTGLMHGMCTLFVGFGISFVRKKRKLFAVGTFALLSAAITYHALFNMLIQSKYPVIGACLPIATYVPFFLWRYFKHPIRKRIDQREKREESPTSS